MRFLTVLNGKAKDAITFFLLNLFIITETVSLDKLMTYLRVPPYTSRLHENLEKLRNHTVQIPTLRILFGFISIQSTDQAIPIKRNYTQMYLRKKTEGYLFLQTMIYFTLSYTLHYIILHFFRPPTNLFPFP